MAWVETRITRTTQPQDGCGLDRTGEFYSRLIAVLDPISRRDLVTNRPMTLVGGFPLTPGKYGRSAQGDAASLGYVTVSGLGAEISILGVMNNATCGASGSLEFGLGSSAGTALACYQAANNPANRFLLRQTNGGGTSAVPFATNAFTTGPYVVGASIAGSLASQVVTYFNGRQDRGTQLDGSSGTNAVFDRFCIGGISRSTNSGAQVGDDCALSVLFRGALSDDEFYRLSLNPWQLYEPEVTRLWIDDTVSTGGAATVIPIGVQATGSVGTPSATGAATTTPAGVSATASVGAPIAVGGASIPATVLPVGVQATGAVGTVSATGAAVAQPVGVVASGTVGTPVAIGEAAGVTVVYPAGVQAVAAVGTPGVIAAARVIPIGVQAVGEVGEPLAYAGDTPPVVATSNYGFEMSAGKRYYIKRKGKILLFDSAEQADDYLAVEQQATVVTSRGAKKRIAAKLVKVAPIETIELEPVTELLSRYMPDVSLPNLLKMRDIEQVLKMQQQALLMQDDEDIELLLMTL